MRAKLTHALPDIHDLRTSGNGCYQSPPSLRPRNQRNGGSGDENDLTESRDSERSVKSCYKKLINKAKMSYKPYPFSNF